MKENFNRLYGIIVLNRNYFPDSEMSAYKVGATHFALETLKCLSRINCLLGLILYKRDEALLEPVIKKETLNGYHSVTLYFNFRMGGGKIRKSIIKAINILNTNNRDHLLIYYHTDTLLQYHPNHIPCCVTHHGPFVEDFIKNYSLIEAYRAFENKEKAIHLLNQQTQGLKVLLSNNNVFVLQHSNLQSRFLRDKGVKDDLILEIIPPIIPKAICETGFDKNLQCFLDSISYDELALVSNAARIDYFKNMDLLVKAAVELIRRNIPIKVIITGGAKDDENKRNELYKQIPESLRFRFIVTERLSQFELNSFFKALKGKGIFVFTSRYETLGITPLEATLNGVCTIMPDSHLVEASRFYPEKYKFYPSPITLADKISELYFGKDYTTGEVNKYVGSIISEENFIKSFTNAWNSMTKAIVSYQAV